MLNLKYKRPTEKEHGHTEVYDNNDKYLGYFMPNSSQFREKGENYNFVSKSDLPNLQASNRDKLINKIEESL